MHGRWWRVARAEGCLEWGPEPQGSSPQGVCRPAAPCIAQQTDEAAAIAAVKSETDSLRDEESIVVSHDNETWPDQAIDWSEADATAAPPPSGDADA